jgi:hypothetical protein
MSASLPGVSVPTLLSRLAQRAPSMVANSSTSRQVTSGGRFCSPRRAPLQQHQALEREGGAHDGERVLRHGGIDVGAQRRPDAVVERVLDGRQAMAHRHLDRRGDRDLRPRVLEQAPGLVAQMRAVDVFVARPQQSGASELDQRALGILAHAMRDAAHADLARISEDLRIEQRAERKREQLVGGAEIAAPQPDDVLGVSSVRTAAAPIGINRADAGILQRANTGVAVLGRVGDLRGVDRGGRAHVDHAERGDQHAGIGVGGRVGRGKRIGDVAVVVGVEQSIGEDVAQKPLIEMVMGVDEAGQHDAVGRIDHRGVVTGISDVRTDLANLAVLDEHVGLGEVADLPIEGKDHAALE